MSAKREIERLYSLSPMQSGMLYQALKNEKSSAYFEQCVFTLQGSIDRALLEESFNTLIARYDVLRTTYVYSELAEPLQVVLKEIKITIHDEDLSSLDQREADVRVEEFQVKDRQRGFDLAKDILMRASLFKMPADSHKLVWSFHHILMDGWCIGIIFNELEQVYRALEQGKLSALTLRPVTPYISYIKWLEEQDRQEGIRYWEQYLEGYEQKAGFSLYSEREPGDRYIFEEYRFEIAEGPTERLNEIVKSNQVTMSAVFQAAWGLLVQKHNYTADVVFGSVVSGRPSEIEGIEEMVGLFINTVPVRVGTDGETLFSELVRTVQQRAISSTLYEYVPLAEIQSHSVLRRDLLDHIVVFENYPVQQRVKAMHGGSKPGILVTDMEMFEHSNYDFQVVVGPGKAMLVKFGYNAAVYSAEFVERTAVYFSQLIGQITGRPDIRVKDLQLLSPREKKQLVEDFNDTGTVYPQDKTIQQIFTARAEQAPERIALVFEDRSVTYRELDLKANQLAGLLRERGVESNTVAGLLLERSIEMIVGILAILKAGGAYLPIDIEYPRERKKYMLADSGAGLLLCREESAAQLELPPQLLNLDIDDGEIYSRKAAVLTDVNRPQDLAYVMYTSGSTGGPKGVLVGHRGVVRLVRNTNYIEFEPSDRLLQTGALAFDASTFEIWGALLNGLELHLLATEKLLVPRLLKEKIRRDHITTIWLTAPLFNQVLEADAEIFVGLKNLLVGGDVLSPVHINRLRRWFPGLRVINGYGPTENTTFSTTHLVKKSYKKSIPIGKPIANSTAYIVDQYHSLLPPGLPGELLVGGDGVSRGYLNDPAQTAERFIDHSPVPAGRLYKTGDMVRRLQDGNIEFMGRIDRQVKIRGFRIELEEIENRLLEIDGIREVVVTRGQKNLCAYIAAGKEREAPELKNRLSEHLPDYMIPSYFVYLEKIPLTANGKVDYRALPEPEMTGAADYEAPRNRIETALVEIYSEVLEIDRERIGINGDFFALGGHSLNAVILASRIQKEFDVKIPMAEIFGTPVIRDLAEYIRAASIEKFISIKAAETRAYYPLSSAQRRLYVIYRLDPGNTGYNVPIILSMEGNIQETYLTGIFRKLINRHESLRTSFKLMGDEPVQKVHGPGEIEFGIAGSDLGTGSGPAVTEWEHAVGQRIKSFIRAFDLSIAPLLRVGLLKVRDGKWMLMIDMHHIICDGTSVGIFVKEFTSLNAGSELPQLRIQYRDFSQWQHSQTEKERIKRQEAYWLKEFSGEIPVLNVPVDYSRPPVRGFEGDSEDFKIYNAETEAVTELAREEDATIFMVLLAVVNILLSKVSGQEDIVVGTTVGGRRHSDLEHIIGMFANALALRNSPAHGKTFREFLREVRQKALDGFENQEYQFEELVEKVVVNRDASRNPLFDIVFAWQELEIPRIKKQALRVKAYKHKYLITKFDMGWVARKRRGRISVRVEYLTQLFKRETIEKFIVYFKRVLTTVADNPDTRLAEISIISAAEKERILHVFNNTDREYPRDKTIHELIEEQAERSPGSIALVHGNLHVTYRAVVGESDILAGVLRSKGVGPGSIVGIMVDHSAAIVLGIAGILKTGGAFLPIEPKLPEDRVRMMLTDCRAVVLLTGSDLLKNKSYTVLQGDEFEVPGIVTTGVRPQITDLDHLPLPDRSLVEYGKYRDYIGLTMFKGALALQASRGCPFNCAYCHKIWPKRHVVRSAPHILDEVMTYYDMGVRRFAFIDDIFNLDRENSARFFELIVEKGPDIQLFFPNGFRGDALTKDYIDLAVQAGTVNIALSLETASPRLQKLIGKNIKLDILRENIDYICRQYPQVILALQTMHGFPGETEEEAMMTLEFVKTTRWLHFPYVHILKIYPNTDMASLAVQHGISEQAIRRSARLAFHEIPETLPFDKDFTLAYQAGFLQDYFLLKERLQHVLPHQLKLLSEDELVQKYDSYLPVPIRSLADFFEFAGLLAGDFPADEDRRQGYIYGSHLDGHLKNYYSREEPAPDALRILLLDLSQFLTHGDEMLYDVVEAPLGLMYILTYLQQEFGSRVRGKIAKSRLDFANFEELKALVCDFRPDLIGVRTLTFYKDLFHQVVGLLRQWCVGIPIVAGGPYATSDYTTILGDRNVNVVVLGEGEKTFAELVGRMIDNEGKFPDERGLREIAGIAFLPEGTEPARHHGRQIVFLDEMGTGDRFYGGEGCRQINRSTDLAYVIYTSGSTGMPKGVMIEQRSLVNLCCWHVNRFAVTPRDRAAKYAGFGFDASVWEIFPYLAAGASIYMIPEEIKLDMVGLNAYFEAHDITMAFLPTQVCEQFMTVANSSLRMLLTGGDWLRGYVRRDYQLVNNYGPTENTVVSTSFVVGEQADNIPIGKPIDNNRVLILDRSGHLQPVGIAGELCIGSVRLSRGYLNQPDLTAEKFVPNPLVSSASSAAAAPDSDSLLYRTGDLARFLPDGNIEFLGRIDFQVKIRGFRVELGEIETRLLEVEKIGEAMVLARESEGGDRYLTAYVVSAAPGEIPDAEELREHLSRSLPDYMIPAYFIQLEKFPLTPAGKIDRQALPAPEFEAASDYVAPVNDIEEKLAAIWSDILHLNKNLISTQANFFQLGGHSLKATVMISRVHRELAVRVPLAEIFKTPTIKGFSEYIKQAVKEKYTLVQAVEKREYYGLSSAQKRLFLLQQMSMHSTVYNIPQRVRLEADIDRERLAQTFRQLIRRHESFRTSFETIDEEPVQRIHQAVDFAVEYLKHRDLQAFVRPFDLSKAPLLRVGLIETGHPSQEGRYILMVDMHHIISDGVSMELLVQEFSALGRGEELPELRFQYKDYACWHNSSWVSDMIQDQEQYWLREFSDEIPVLNLPTDYPRPRFQSFKGSTIGFEMDAGTVARLNRLTSTQGATLYMVLLAVFNVLLFRLSSQEDIIVGVPVAGRGHADLERIIGMFVNTLALRNYPEGSKSFREFINEVKERSVEALANQEYQFEDLVERVAVRRDAGRNPLFDVMFALQNFGTDSGGAAKKPGPRESAGSAGHGFASGVARFDMTWGAVERGERLFLAVEYCTELFKRETVERFITFFNRIVQSVLPEPDIRLAEIEIISGAEREQILYVFNDTGREYPGERTIQELFAEQAEISPQAVSVLFEDRLVTYKELNDRADRLAAYLYARGVSSGEPVGIMADRSVEMLIGLLAILKAGGAYLPVNTGYPEKRKQYLLQDSQVKVLLTDCRWSEPVEPGQPIKVIDLREVVWEGERFSAQRPQPAPLDLAYIIYTSGSTGNPKGVMVAHRHVVRLVKNTNYIVFNRHERILPTGALEFDASTFEIWGALLNRLVLVLAVNDKILIPQGLKETIRKYDIRTMWLTAPLFNQMLDADIEIFGGLGNLLVGGDVLSPVHINRLRARYPRLRVINGYGPTENTTFSTTFLINRDYRHSIPIGRPIANSTAYIFDRRKKLQPIGVAGELWVGGDGVSRGYLNRPGLTMENFVDDPFVPGGRIYKTGDLARFLPDGSIEFLGRIDFQVKIRGFRIELGEIEIRLLEMEEIREAAVIARENETGDRYLAAYVVLSPEGRGEEMSDISKLRKYLSRTLPDYMIPAYFIQLEQMPFTPAGKIDRRALAVADEDLLIKKDPTLPRNQAEQQILEVWEKVLNVKKIGVFDDFFEMGGNSLSALKVVVALARDFDITMADLFVHPCAAELAAHIALKRDNLKLKIWQAKERLISPEVNRQRRALRSKLKENYEEYKNRIAREKWRGLKANRTYGHILLTGSTGYLGSHLVYELLKNRGARLYLLVRGKSPQEAADRLKKRILFYFGVDFYEETSHRLHVVSGDITEQGLGLDRKQYGELSEKVDAVFHAAANVKHFGFYRDFYKTNVEGTERLLEFALSAKEKDFHFISTMGVGSGNLENREYQLFSEFCLNSGQNHGNPYVKSKYEAEQRVLSSRQRGLNAAIYRMANLVFHSHTGQFQENIEDNGFYMSIKAMISQGVVPANGTHYDMTFVDHAARSVVLLAGVKNFVNETFHLQNPHWLGWETMDPLFERAGIKVQVLRPELFFEFLEANLERADMRDKLERYLLHSGLLGENKKTGTMTMMVSDRTQRILKKLGFEWPEVTEQHIQCMIDYCRGIGFLD
jgi:amino acid adenylation domain-containing protein/thioester reductase-like protein